MWRATSGHRSDGSECSTRRVRGLEEPEEGLQPQHLRGNLRQELHCICADGHIMCATCTPFGMTVSHGPLTIITNALVQYAVRRKKLGMGCFVDDLICITAVLLHLMYVGDSWEMPHLLSSRLRCSRGTTDDVCAFGLASSGDIRPMLHLCTEGSLHWDQDRHQ